MELSEKIDQLAAALVLAQPEIETAKMDCVNPFFKSKYADLGSVWDAVRPALAKNGLTVTQFPDSINGEPALTTMLIHQSGQWMKATYPLVVAGKDENAQGYGSAITYARRYGLSAVLGVIADADDDGNSASKHPKPDAVKQPPPSKVGLGTLADPFTKDWKAWGQKVLDAARTIPVENLTGLLDKNSGDLVKLHAQEPVLHKDIIALVQNRQALGK